MTTWWCYPCTLGQCDKCNLIAWLPDIPCEHKHATEEPA